MDRSQIGIADHLNRLGKGEAVNTAHRDASGVVGRVEELRTGSAIEQGYRSSRCRIDCGEQIRIVCQTEREAGSIGRVPRVIGKLAPR